MSGVTSYIGTVTLAVLERYAPELALPGLYYRILLTVTFQINNDGCRVHPPRPSLSGGDPDVRTLNYLTVGRLTDIRKGRRTGQARFETRALSELPAGSVPTLASDVGGGAGTKEKGLLVSASGFVLNISRG
jgi:hypothetical protein